MALFRYLFLLCLKQVYLNFCDWRVVTVIVVANNILCHTWICEKKCKTRNFYYNIKNVTKYICTSDTCLIFIWNITKMSGDELCVLNAITLYIDAYLDKNNWEFILKLCCLLLLVLHKNRSISYMY